jgi:hypothetical protein
MQRKNSLSDKLFLTKTTSPPPATWRKTVPVSTLLGLTLIGLGLVGNHWLISQVALRFGIALDLNSMAGTMRLWLLKIFLISIGAPVALYSYRARSRGKTLFDTSVGLALALVVLIFFDGTFFILNTIWLKEAPQTRLSYSEPYLLPDDTFGYRLKADTTVSVRQQIADQVIYDVTYTTDPYGRRVTPTEPQRTTKEKFILFLGDSFTFGDGVNDDQTLPFYVAQLAADYQPYNYGVSGYGPQQLFLTLQQDQLRQEIKEPTGLAVYTFICPHLRRAIGASEVHNAWGGVMPYFSLDRQGKLIRQGNFVSGRPFISILYNLVGSSEAAKYFNVRLPAGLSEPHFRLTVTMIEAAQAAFAAKFPRGDFYVLFYPEQRDCGQQLRPYLAARGLKYLDYSELFEPGQAADLAIPDGHPTAQAYHLVAEQLVRDLGLAAEPVVKVKYASVNKLEISTSIYAEKP